MRDRRRDIIDDLTVARLTRLNESIRQGEEKSGIQEAPQPERNCGMGLG